MTDQTAAPDDLTGHYMAHRLDVEEQSALSDMLSRAAKEESPSGPAVPATSPVQGQPTVAPKHGLAYRAAADVAKGATIQAPGAIVGGIRDAYQNTVNLAKDVGDWVEQKLDLPVLMVGKDGVHVTTNEEAKGHRLSDLAELPDASILHPDTVTGNLIKGVAQFLTGFKGAGKVMEAAGVPELTGAAGYVKTAAQGAAANFAVFDPQQQRLSNLIEKFPALSNPVTQYLEAKPDDSKAEGRLKNALEGLSLGVLTDGLVRGIKLLRDVETVKGQPVGEVDPNDPMKGLESDLGPEPPPEGAPEPPQGPKALGDASEQAPLIYPRKPFDQRDLLPEGSTATPESVGTAAEGAPSGEPEAGKFQSEAGPAGSDTGPTRINFARIQSPDDVQRVMQHLANEHAGEIDAARRGTQTFEQIKLNADQENAWDILNSRRVGQPLNAEQITAARELWASSAQKLTEVSQIAREAPTEENLAAFVKMLETHRVIQNNVRGAQTETARALAAMRIPVGSAATRLSQLDQLLTEGYGGMDNVRDLADRVWGLSQAQMPNELEALVQKSAYVKTRDALIQAWTDALLTAPTTQARILASNATTALWRIGERFVAEKVSNLAGDNAIAPGEAAAMWQAYTGGWRDTFTAGWKTFKTGVTGEGIGDPHPAYPSKLSSDALGLTQDSFWGKAADFLGTALSLPRRGIAAQHDMALTQAYRAELNAQALRTATSELNAGRITEDAFGERVADLLQNPPPNLKMNAQAAGRYQAFLDEPGAVAQKMLELRQDVPALRIILPFIKIPARIFSYTMERTPLAPLMGKFQSDIAAGGARRDLAIAQVGLGTAAMMAVADMTLAGRIKAQGPLEKGLQQAQEREGERNWSVQVGDKWVDYNGIHPAGKLIGLAAAVTEAIANGQHELKDDADTEKLTVATALAIAGNLANSSYTQGLANFFAMVHDSRTGGAGEGAILSTVGSVVPSAVATAARATDPYQRAVYGMLDEFKSRIPGLSKSLPPRRDLWGDPVSSGYGPVTDMISPAKIADVKHSPIDDEMLKQGFNIPMPSTNQAFGQGATVDLKHYPEAYSRFLELAGHEYKDPAWGLGAKDLLSQIVSGEHPMSAVYNLRSDGPEGGKEVFVRDMIAHFRDGAKRQLLDEFPKLAAEVAEKQQHAQDIKLPTIQ